MGFSLSGLVGAGAQDALSRQVAEQLRQAMFEEEQRQAKAREGIALGEQQSRERDRDERNRLMQELRDQQRAAAAAQAEKDAYDQTAAANMAELTGPGMESQLEAFGLASGQMKPIDILKLRQEKPKKFTPVVSTRGPKGEEVLRQFEEGAPELLQGVPGYERGTAGEKPTYVKIMRPDGTMTIMTPEEIRGQGGVAVAPKQAPVRPVTDAERKAKSFFDRGKEAHEITSRLEPEIAKMGLLQQGRMALAPNFMQSQMGQSYIQAQRAFTEARLRKESGAAVPPSEYENDARTYFAQPGDSAKTLAQKKAGRERVLAGIANEARRAIAEYYTGSGDQVDAGSVTGGVDFVFNPATGALEPVKK